MFGFEMIEKSVKEFVKELFEEIDIEEKMDKLEDKKISIQIELVDKNEN